MSLPDNQLLAWVSSIVQQQQKAKSYGKITISLHAGKVVGVNVEQCHKPSRDDGAVDSLKEVL